MKSTVAPNIGCYRVVLITPYAISVTFSIPQFNFASVNFLKTSLVCSLFPINFVGPIFYYKECKQRARAVTHVLECCDENMLSVSLLRFCRLYKRVILSTCRRRENIPQTEICNASSTLNNCDMRVTTKFPEVIHQRRFAINRQVSRRQQAYLRVFRKHRAKIAWHMYRLLRRDKHSKRRPGSSLRGKRGRSYQDQQEYRTGGHSRIIEPTIHVFFTCRAR